MNKKQNIIITCQDNFEIAGTLYQPKAAKAAVMIAPATGIKRHFYDSFATHLSEHGYGVICFDNRGIGDSTKGHINQINASLISWGTSDMTAVMQTLKSYFPDLSHHIVGHSAGGQLIGLMENALEVKSFFNFASSSGSLGHMNYPFKLTASFFLNIFIPVSNLLFGQTNSHWVGMGQPLPKKVAAQWRKWCNSKGYVEADFGQEIKTHHYDEIKCPSLWLHATDDGIANLENVKDMTRIYSQSATQIQTLDPIKLNKKSLGHMGFFCSKNKDLWNIAVDFFDENSK